MHIYGEKANEKTHEYEETSTQTEVILQMNRSADGVYPQKDAWIRQKKGG